MLRWPIFNGEITVISTVLRDINACVSGWIYDVTNNYNIPFYVAGAVELTAGVLFLTLLIPSQQPAEAATIYVLETKLKEKLKLESESAFSSTLSLAALW